MAVTAVWTGTNGALSLPILTLPTAVAADVYYLDAVMLEEGASASDFRDDFNLGEDKTPGNLLPVAAQSFEDGTVPSVFTTAVTVTNSTARAYSGTRSLISATASVAAIGTVNFNSLAAGYVVGRTYTGAASMSTSRQVPPMFA